MRTAAEILEEARRLSAKERALIAETLLSEAYDRWQSKLEAPESGYDEWFHAGVEEALADTSPGISHEDVVEQIKKVLRSSREAKRYKASA
jgi:hypothetical protein